ncbi:hypothetical protein bas19_0062 [Escherichia phage ChristophMerian]|nr:hypothetical protein bas19_0062 [Escherichia phage ChristophMerian]
MALIKLNMNIWDPQLWLHLRKMSITLEIFQHQIMTRCLNMLHVGS